MNNTTRHSPVPQRFSGAWEIKRFEEVFQRLNGKLHQVPASEYNAHGLHPVIDQGQLFIVAFSNRTDKLFKCPADGVIVFGDHTRVVKYVTMDFLIGADGTQLLATQGSNVTQFFFYQLLAKEIPDTGYNRHFKFLKEATWAVPTLAEQRAIAEVLSDVDSLLDTLDALIAKKRVVKHAAMQQLLTGETRLPGFSGEWKTKQLGSIGRCLRGVSYDPTTDLASYDKEGTVRLLRANNVQGAVVTVTDIQYVESHRVADFQVMQPDDILICMANGSKALVGKAGLFRIQDGYTYAFGAFMGCFRVDSTLADARFVFYLLQTGEFRDYIGLVLAGSSINNLKPRDIEEAGFRLPARDEQTAIADILSDMDAEIEALEQRRDKVRAIKQGMMQELLTGRVRLVKSA